MATEGHAFARWRRHLEEVIGVDDGNTVADEVATKTFIRSEFDRHTQEMLTVLHQEINKQTWRMVTALIATQAVTVAILRLTG